MVNEMKELSEDEIEAVSGGARQCDNVQKDAAGVVSCHISADDGKGFGGHHRGHHHGGGRPHGGPPRGCHKGHCGPHPGGCKPGGMFGEVLGQLDDDTDYEISITPISHH